jgi:uncharacterized repeat protein (TIGR04076 family)
MSADDTFELYDLRVSVEAITGTCTCNLHVGDAFELCGGTLTMSQDSGFCVYALQSTLPLLPAKQRPLQSADWMSTDSRIHCPDPACGTIMRVDRVGKRTIRHADVSAQA